jgi:PTH1 family peptidyl-tRNA hydrolase
VAVVLGLGNPGNRYARTRHNAGFRVVEELRRRWPARPLPGDAPYRAWAAEIREQPVFLVTPMTYMNLSGDALRAWQEQHPDAGELLVVADDVYLPVGYLRLRGSGSSGGHRGLESIETALGGTAYARLRIGVGATEAAELRDHVLDEPAAAEAEAYEASIGAAADAIECWLGDGLSAAMNRFNKRVRKEVSEP